MSRRPPYPCPDGVEFTFTCVADIPKVEDAIKLCDYWIGFNAGRCHEDCIGTPEIDQLHFEALLSVLQKLKRYEEKFGKLDDTM